MSFNVKSRLADAVVQAALSKPAGHRHGCTGFWKASLKRVLEERYLRIATLNGHRFLLLAEIDPEGTHTMQPERLGEYIEHEFLKQSLEQTPLSQSEAEAKVKERLVQGRIVVAFKDARAISGSIETTSRNPVWYEEEH